MISDANLERVFGENAQRAREVLNMTRDQLLDVPEAWARCKECYHPPSTTDLRMTVLNTLANTHGVEGICNSHGEWLTYLNAGDTYNVTLCHWRGKYRVTTWGDIVEDPDNGFDEDGSEDY